MFDSKTKKFFYYNAFEQKTSWHRPNYNRNTILINEKENEQTSQTIPLASKLIERINSNLVLIKKSKKFLKFLRKKLETDFKYDLNDLDIMSTLTERLLNIQNILTEDDDQSCAFIYDFSSLEMSSFIHVSNMSSPIKSIDLNESSATNNTSIINSPLSSCYSFKSTQSIESNSNTLNKKRRLAPRTNPNYVNVDFVNTKNGTLIKNTYVRLQDLTNENELDTSRTLYDDEMSSSTPVANNVTTSNNNNSTLTQAIFILISLLSTNTGGISKPVRKNNNKITIQEPKLSSSSSSMNTICSLTNSTKNGKSFKNISLNNDQTFSLCSSSATIITDSNVNQNTATGFNPDKKHILPAFKSVTQISNSNNTYSLNRKILDKNSKILSRHNLIIKFISK